MKSSNSNTASILAIQRLIESSESILVTSHMDGDGDSIGTQLAVLDYLAWLGKKAVAAHESELPDSMAFLAASSRLNNVRNAEAMATVERLAPYDLLIVLECPNPGRMGAVWNFKSEHTKVINIDHHPDNIEFGDALWVVPGASSVGELMAEYFAAVQFPFGEKTAEALYTAILTDTGRFQYPSATSRTFEIVANILKRDINIRDIADSIYHHRSHSSLRLLGSALSNMRMFASGRGALITLTKEDFEIANASAEECEGIVEYTLMTAGSEVGALVRSMDGAHSKVSLRSRGKYDISTIAAQFGGGGHAGAAGCKLEGSTPEAAEIVVAKLTALLESSSTAKVTV
jgi:bifunctional oligoribonuclease and PAP phosphatase NrnA